MERLKKISLIISLIERLSAKGSWCGETHVQKAIYLLQTLTNVPFSFDFILYKHGPFSFELRDDLIAMNADSLINNKIQPFPYGPTLVVSNSGEELKRKFPKTIEKYNAKIESIAKLVGNKTVAELERLGTALYITKKENETDQKKRAERIKNLKPHVSQKDALIAVKSVDNILVDFKEI